MKLPGLDELTRGHALLAFGVIAGVVGFVLVIAPGLVPAQFGDLQPTLDGDTVYTTAVVLAVVLVGVALYRVISGGSTPLDRSPISDESPEEPGDSEVPTVSESAEQFHDRLLSGFDHAGTRRRYVAMYGRRAERVERIPPGVESMLDELATTAAETHAVAARTSEGEARRAVARGTWTEDRIAAAFLASDPEAAPTFRTRERLLAWIAPRHTFESRLRHTVEEIERQAGALLTYESEEMIPVTAVETAADRETATEGAD